MKNLLTDIAGVMNRSIAPPMSVVGQKATSTRQFGMSVSSPGTDIP
jgi:hypothetical protein